MVALPYYLSLRGPLGWCGRCTGGVRLPHLHVMGVWRERPLDVLLRDGPLPVGGGAVVCWARRFLVREWTRLRRLMALLRAVSVALLFLVLVVW